MTVTVDVSKEMLTWAIRQVGTSDLSPAIAHRLDEKNKTKRARIPDVARQFDVKIITLFNRMGELSISL